MNCRTHHRRVPNLCPSQMESFETYEMRKQTFPYAYLQTSDETHSARVLELRSEICNSRRRQMTHIIGERDELSTL